MGTGGTSRRAPRSPPRFLRADRPPRPRPPPTPRALEAAPGAAPADAAAVLAALAAAAEAPPAAAGPAAPPPGPGPEWVEAYVAAARPKLADADAGALASLCASAASLGARPGAPWLRDAAAAGRALLGSGYADAGRIRNAPGWRRPFDLPQLADALWGLAKMGARGQEVRTPVFCWWLREAPGTRPLTDEWGPLAPLH
jgi:hypothetical protein